MYRVEYDRAAHLLTLTLRGLLSVEEAEAFAEAIRLEMIAVSKRGEPLRVLIDSAHSQVQSPAVIAVLSRMKAAFADPPRTAVVLGSTLQKLQTRRTTTVEMPQIFATVEAAMAWLDAPGAAVPPGPEGPPRVQAPL